MRYEKEYIFIYKRIDTGEEIFRHQGYSIMEADKLFHDKFDLTINVDVETFVEDVKRK